LYERFVNLRIATNPSIKTFAFPFPQGIIPTELYRGSIAAGHERRPMTFFFRYRWAALFLILFVVEGCASWNKAASPSPPVSSVPVEAQPSMDQKPKKAQSEAAQPVKHIEDDGVAGKKLGQTSKHPGDILLPPAPVKPPAVGGSGG